MKSRAATASVSILILLFAGTAAAHRISIKTTVTAQTIDGVRTTAVKGVVKSPRTRCVSMRRVNVFRVVDGPDTFKTFDKTNSTGGWQASLGAHPTPGTYYGKIARKNIGTGAHRHMCRAATSSQVTVIASRPTVTIESPDDGETRSGSVPIPFVGSANDPQDGDLTGGSIVWTSSLDGQIGTGESFSQTLSVGSHVITATATDTDGKIGTDKISLEIV